MRSGHHNPRTLPRKIAERFAPHLRILEHPLDVGSFDGCMAWPQRLSSDPAHRWLRALVAAIAI